MASSDLPVAIGPGLDFVFEAPAAALRLALATALSCFAQDEEEPSSSPLVVKAESAAAELVESTSVILEQPPLIVRGLADQIHFAMPEIGAWCDPGSERAGIVLGRPGSSQIADFVHLALPSMLIELAIARGWIGLHAAAVSMNGEAVLPIVPECIARKCPLDPVRNASRQGIGFPADTPAGRVLRNPARDEGPVPVDTGLPAACV